MKETDRQGAAPRWIFKGDRLKSLLTEASSAQHLVATDDCDLDELLEGAEEDDLVVISAGDLHRLRSSKAAGTQGLRGDADATQRSQGEELRIFFQALEQSPSIVVIADVYGRVEYVNPEFCRVSGFGLEEVLGSPLASIGNLPNEMATQIADAVDNRTDWQGDLPCEKKSGEIYWEMATISPLRDEQGQVTHFVKVADDISLRKEVEAKLEAAMRKAEAASSAKSLFLAGITHELRTPLHAIIGFSEVLIEEAFGTLGQKQARYVRNILDSGRNLLNLIDQVLDLSKMESGQVELDLGLLDLERVLKDEAEQAGTGAGPSGAGIAVEIDGSLRPAHVVADEDRMRQIVHNLFVSALKLSGGHGSITARAGRQGDEVVVSVHHGVAVGMTPSELARVFDDLERVFDPAEVESVGAGLGLAVAKRLVILHGGRVWAEAKSGTEASLCFAVPAAAQQKMSRYQTLGASRAPVGPMIADLTGPVGGTALVVQHEEYGSALLERYLEDAGHVLSHAYDAKQALDMAKRYSPDIVIIDLVDAEVEAWDVTMSLRGDPATRHICILEVSENEQGDLRVARPLVEAFERPSEEAALRSALARELSFRGESVAGVLFVDRNEEGLQPLIGSLDRLGARVHLAKTGTAAIEASVEMRPHVCVVNPLSLTDVIFEDFIAQLLVTLKDAGRLFVYSSKPLSASLKRTLGRLTREVELHESGKKNLLAALDVMCSCPQRDYISGTGQIGAKE